MGSELNIAATERELAYRSKNYSDLKAFEKREHFCSSCGNILSHDSRHIYSHPIFGILQCENCKNHFKTVTFSLDKDDSVRNCHICGRERSSSYGCVKPNCPYEFCKTCIKRNVPQSLVDAESGKWKCFACNPKPLWKLRGACAAVMSSLSKRTKPKKVKSRERSSDREDERSDLKDISYVRRTQLERTNKLSKKLSSICDTESPLQESQTSASARKDSDANGNRRDNRTDRNPKKTARVKSRGGALRLTSSDDSDVEIVPLHRKKVKNTMVKTKINRENSGERSKKRARDRQSRNDTVVSKKARGRGGRKDDDSSESENSSDDSELEKMESRKSSRRTSSSNKRQKSRRAEKSRNSRRDASSDSSSDDSVTASMKRLMPTAFAKKPKNNEKSKNDRNEKNNSTSTRRRDSSDDEEIASKKSSRSVTTKSAEPTSRSEKKRKLRRSASLDWDETVTETKKKSSRPAGQNVSVILSDVANVVEKNSRKTFGHLGLSRSKPGSDSSSSKEFRRSKICHKSGVALHRVQDIEEDLTMQLPDDRGDDSDVEIPKQQSFALRKSVKNFFADLKSSATKLIGEIERAEKAYFPKEESMRESMKPVDARRMIVETRNVLKGLHDRVDQNETKITEYYDGWCKKTRQRNVWRTPVSRKRRSSASGKINAKNSDESGSESSEPKKIGPSKKTESRAASPESVVANGEKPVVVSECDSEEIFSNDETRMSISRGNADTSEGRRKKEKSDERSRRSDESKNRKNSSEKSEVAVDEDKVDPGEKTDDAGKTGSPTMSQFSGHTDVDADEVRSRAPSPMDQDEDRESLNRSPDLFETSVEVDLQEKKSSDREMDDTNTEKISPRRKTSQVKSKATVSDVESESDDSKKATSRADEFDGSKKSSSRAVRSPGGEESENSRGASSRAVSPAGRESDGSQDGQSRAASPGGRESDGSQDGQSRAASPAPECDGSTRASSRAASPGRESDSSKKASSRAVSPGRESDSSKKASSRAVSPGRESDSSKKASSRAVSPGRESDSSKKASSRAVSPGRESDSSKKASSRAVSPGRESDSSKKASSRAVSPGRESDSSKKASSRAVSPGQESDSSKKASSRAVSPGRESDSSKKASSRAVSPGQESDSSKKASSRAPSPAAEGSPRAVSDASKKSSSATRGSDDSDASDGEKSKEVVDHENSDKISVDGFSDSEDINPQEMVEALVEELAVASDTENPEAEVDTTSANKSSEKIAPSDGDSVLTELYDKSDQPEDDEKLTEKNGKSKNEKSKKQESSRDRKEIGGEKKRDSSRRSSSNAASTDDLDGSTKKSKKSKKSKNDDSSSDLSDADNARAREAMLMSSNSDDSSAENSSKNRRSNPKESNDSPLTPPESDSKSDRSSKSVERRLPERESEDDMKNSENDKRRKKRSKFRLNKNRFYIADEKLRQNCEVRVKRLKNRILKRYSRALRKSRKYVESKEIQRLVALNKLDQNKSKAASGSSDDEDSSKTLTRNKKKTQAKEREETLMDHLKKVKNGENIEVEERSSESDGDSTKSEKKNKTKDNGDDSLFAEANRMAKKRMLDSSESGAEEQPDSDAKDEKPVEKTKKVVKKEKLSKSSEDEEDKKEKADKAEKGRWRKSKILTLKISDSDSDEERQKFESKKEKLSSQKSQGSDSEEEEEESSAKKKKRVRRRVLHSDSDVEVSPISNSDSDSSVQSSKKKKKKKKDDDSDADEGEKKKTRKRTRRTRSSDSSMDEERPKPTRRKRIKTAGTDSDSDEDVDNSQGSPGKTGRKNIRKVLRDKQVAEDTKQAAKDEEERLKRIAERQKLYNEMYEVRLAGEEKVEKLVLDFDEETKEPLVSVDEGLVKRLKPHQAQGIKFMWDACFESLERTKNTKGSGCILAHCMGLGKSFQIVTLAHTLLMHPETGIKTVLVVCPLSTVLNWANEFKIWLSDLPSADDIEIYEMTKMKKPYERKYQLEHWRKTGGVMILGYEMFRNLSSGGKRLRKAVQESFIKSLVDPGPDLIVCDEGHLLKKEATALSKAMSKVRTLRRIVLTGTPLQNNLIEYHCMVQFVKPNLLGTKREFMNRFENPITNGQFDDSTEYDVKLMKKRAHVLHKMLEGSVQRFDYSVLTPFLPPKQEYVIFVKLTEVQIQMYQYYLENYARSHRGVGGSLFADFQALQRIWTHPMVMQMNAERTERANEKRRLDNSDSEGSLKDFIDDGSDTPCTSEDSDVQSASGSEDEKGKKKPQRSTRANPVVDEAEPEATTPGAEENSDEAWWTQFIKSDDVYEDIRISTKLLLLFRILKECEQIGDKVLVFSQSLYSLTLIEKFLGMIDEETQKGNHPEHLDGHSGNWALGLDYFRLDGQSSADNRRLWCNVFNKPSNTRARLFLISTRAGGLGINLTAANRVIIFDASWNPSHDVQSIFRIYRFGQKKPCYVYRLLAAGTMEEKIYNRQVTKLSLSCRVVDEQQIERHYTNNALAELYKLELPSTEETTLNLPKDRLLAEIFLKYAHTVERYHEHDSLLENQAGEELDEEERQQAWLEYEEEKKGRRIGQPMGFMNQEQMLLQQINMMNLQQQQNILNNPDMLDMFQKYQGFMQKDYPGLPDAQHKILATQAIYEMYNSVERQAVSGQRSYPMMNVPNVAGAQFGYNNQMQTAQPIQGHPSMDTLRLYQQSLAQAQNGMMNNYTNNQGQIGGHGIAHQRQAPMAPMGQISGMSAVSSSIDDDIVEIPSSPERNPVPSGSAPSGSGKSKEE